MSQRITGWRLPLSLPGVYTFFQNLLGGPQPWRDLVKIHIRPEKGMHILDIGCGPAAILDYLPESVHYVGVDLSQEYINAARKQYGPRGEFHCMPAESFQKNGNLSGFDLVMGLGLLHHLDDTQAMHFFSAATNALRSHGRCLTVDPCMVDGQHPLARFLIRMDRGQNVRTAEAYLSLAKPFFNSAVQNIYHDWLRVPYTHHIMECRH